MAEAQYSTNEEGERVIAASRRPDGTLRKERRVRAGYIPQDEVQVYQSRGTLAKQNVPKCPGAADDEVNGASKAKSKAAAKNAKRKEKRLAEAAAGGGGAAAAAAGVAALSLNSSGNGSKGSAAAAPVPTVTAPPASAEAAAASSEPVSPEKQLRALKKKVRQAEGLAAKAAEGAALTEEEAAKLSKLEAWQAEIAALEAQLGA